MSAKYCLKVGTRLLEREGDLALFSSLANHVYLRSPAIDAVFAALCSRLVTPASAAELEVIVGDPAKLKLLLALLEKHDLLLEFSEADCSEGDFQAMQKSPLARFYESPKLVVKFEAALKLAKVRIVDLADRGSIYAQKLSAVGIAHVAIENFEQAMNWEHSPKSDEVILVLASWQQARQLKSLNARFYASLREWTLVLEDEFGGQIGPRFSGRDSPCFECLLKRKESFLEGTTEETLIRRTFFLTRPERVACFPLLTDMLAGFTATEIYKRVAGVPVPRLWQGAFLIDVLNLKMQYHELFPVPFCETCSGVLEAPLGGTFLPDETGVMA